MGKGLATNPDDLSLLPRICVMGRTVTPAMGFLTSTHMQCAPPYTYTTDKIEMFNWLEAAKKFQLWNINRNNQYEYVYL